MQSEPWELREKRRSYWKKKKKPTKTGKEEPVKDKKNQETVTSRKVEKE